MDQRHRQTEPIVFSLVAIFLLIAAGLSLYAEIFGSLWSLVWKERNSSILLLFAAYGLCFAVLAWVSFALIHYRKERILDRFARLVAALPGELRGLLTWALESTGSHRTGLWITAVMGIAMMIRAYFLAQPMRYDESLTFLNFIHNDFIDLFSYPEPNNHILHSIFVRITVAFFGDQPAAIRLPAFLAGIAVIPASFLLCRILTGGRSGFFAAALISVFPYIVLFDTMARGYSLVVLFSLCLAIIGLRFLLHPSLALCFLISLIGAFGLLTMPSFLFPLLGLYLWIILLLVLERKDMRFILKGFVLPCATMTAVLTALFYTPTIVATKALNLNNRFVAALDWRTFFNRLPGHLTDTFSMFLRDVPLILSLVVLLLCALGIFFAVKRRNWGLLFLLPALVAGSAVLLFAKHAIPFDRTWIFFIPFAFVLADAGFAGIIGVIKPYSRYSLLAILFIFTFSWAIVLMGRDTIASYPNTGRFAEAPAVADFLSREMRRGDRMKAKIPANVPLAFYMVQKGIPRDDVSTQKRPARIFFVVEKSAYSIDDLTKNSGTKLMELGNAVVYGRYLSEK